MRPIIVLTIVFCTLTNCSDAQNQEKTSKINSIFDQMEQQGVDLKKPLLFGYFFFNKDKSNLENIKDVLLREKYKLNKLVLAGNNEFVLHVEKVEIHSRISLLERQKQLSALANKFHVLYDGWDVGNADPNKPLVSKDNESLDEKSKLAIFKDAIKLYDSEDYDNAIIVLQKCIDSNFKVDTSYYKQGVSYMVLGQKKVGIDKFEEALKINPKYFKAYFNVGASTYDIHDFQKSIEFYQKAAVLEPQNDAVYYGIAASQFAIGQLKESASNCQKALKINPSNSNASSLINRINKK